MRKYSIVVAALFLLALMPQANGDLIIGDLSGAGYSQGSGYSMGPGGGVNNFIAQGFTMTDTYNLTSVDLSLYLFGPQAGSTFILSIYSDNGSNAPGSDLYDLTTDVVGSNSGSPTIASFGGSFELTSGTTYWLDLQASNPSSQTGNSMVWAGAFDGSSNHAVPMGSGATEVGQQRTFSFGSLETAPTTLLTAFQINGTPVPEPSSIALAAFGLVGLAAWRVVRRKK